MEYGLKQRSAAAEGDTVLPDVSATYDPATDIILVLLGHRISTEVPPADPGAPLFLFECDEGERDVGFAVRPAMPFCVRHHVVHNGAVLLCELIDKIAMAFPAEKDACDVVQDFLLAHGILRIVMGG